MDSISSDFKFIALPYLVGRCYGVDPRSLPLERVIGIGTSLEGLMIPQDMKIEAEILHAKRTISKLSKLKAGWDGALSRPLHRDAIQAAETLIKNISSSERFLASSVEITPNTNGTITFEWDSALGSAYLEFGATRFVFFIDTCSTETPVIEGSNIDFSAQYLTQIRSSLFPYENGLFVRTSLSSSLNNNFKLFA
jgi:hypothetical protein